MGFSDFIAAVFAANVATAAFLWACFQFHRHDTDAPWLAYAAFIMPLIFLIGSVIATGGLPPQFDALTLR